MPFVKLTQVHNFTVTTMSSKFCNHRAIHTSDETTLADSKNCKLCRKRMSNEHFKNPKNGSLFSVCDICRQRKRDKYWSIF